MGRLSGKVAIVTGAASGQGAAKDLRPHHIRVNSIQGILTHL